MVLWGHLTDFPQSLSLWKQMTLNSLRSHEHLPVLNCHLIVVREAIQSPAPSVKRGNHNKLDQKKMRIQEY